MAEPNQRLIEVKSPNDGLAKMLASMKFGWSLVNVTSAICHTRANGLPMVDVGISSEE